ncbi:MAG: VanZ family protein [Turicibacter sp.]|nr:VanZ family protein [Turicibacter sp.]
MMFTGHGNIVTRLINGFGGLGPAVFLFICVSLFGEVFYAVVVANKRKEQGLKTGVKYRVWRYVFYLYVMMVYIQTGTAGAFWWAGAIDPSRIYLVPFTTSPDVVPYILNVLMTIPLGFLLPLIWPSFRQIGRVALAGFLFSFSIEFVQLFSLRVSSTSDLITNTAGAVIGYGMFYLMYKWAARGVDVVARKEVASKAIKHEPAIYLALSLIGAVLLYQPWISMALSPAPLGVSAETMMVTNNEGVASPTRDSRSQPTQPDPQPLATALSYQDVNFQLHSRQAFLLNLTTGELLFEHGADERVYPASLTKIMTVLLGIEQARGETMTVRADFNRLLLDNASVAGFEYGEERTLNEILHGAMLPSGADATATIAYNTSGSYEAFVALMNTRAQELGMSNTNFTNTSGLHHDHHYTTARDMAILLSYALENPHFRDIFTAREYTFITFWGEHRVMSSTLFTNMWTNEFTGGSIIGGRTGFTYAAGRCLASLATNGTDEFILISFGADAYAGESTAHILDAFTIYEYFLSRD